MKRIIFLLMALVVAAGVCFASDDQAPEGQKKSREKMWKELQEFKLKYLAQEMELEEGQKQKFFDLYNQMTEEKSKLFRETMALERKVRKNPEATEEDYAEVSKAMTAAKEKEAEIDKKYDEKFSKFLTSKQIYKMKLAEDKFRQKMERMRKKDQRHKSDRREKKKN